MLAIFKKKLGDKAAEMSGNKDVLEATCAIAALVAAADGDISDGEINATIKSVKANDALRLAYKEPEIQRAAEVQLGKAAGGRVGKLGLKNELRDVAERFPQFGEIVFLAGLDVAEADGSIDDKEKAVLEECATIFGLKYSSYV